MQRSFRFQVAQFKTHGSPIRPFPLRSAGSKVACDPNAFLVEHVEDLENSRLTL